MSFDTDTVFVWFTLWNSCWHPKVDPSFGFGLWLRITCSFHFQSLNRIEDGKNCVFSLKFWENLWKLPNTLNLMMWYDISYWKRKNHHPTSSSSFKQVLWLTLLPPGSVIDLTQLREKPQGSFFNVFFFGILAGFVGDPVGNSIWFCDLMHVHLNIALVLDVVL